MDRVTVSPRPVPSGWISPAGRVTLNGWLSSVTPVELVRRATDRREVGHETRNEQGTPRGEDDEGVRPPANEKPTRRTRPAPLILIGLLPAISSPRPVSSTPASPSPVPALARGTRRYRGRDQVVAEKSEALPRPAGGRDR